MRRLRRLTFLAPAVLVVTLLPGTSAGAGAPSQDRAVQSYGAIAVHERSGIFDGVYAKRTRAAARAAAMEQCTALAGSPCRVVVTAHNGCAAVALHRRADGTVTVIGRGHGRTKAAAIREARADAGRRINGLPWVCSFG